MSNFTWNGHEFFLAGVPPTIRLCSSTNKAIFFGPLPHSAFVEGTPGMSTGAAVAGAGVVVVVVG